MKKMKRVLAFILTIVMVLSVLPVSVQKAEAAGTSTIELNDPYWSSDMKTYRFQNADVNFGGEGQKIFCLSVDNGGTFILPGTVTLGANGTKITGIQKTGDEFEYVGNVSGSMELSSITVIGTEIADSEIESFIEGLVFNRNGVGAKEAQTISVVANQVTLDEDMTVMAEDGNIHYYKYVPFTDGREPYDATKGSLTWYDAYNAAKADTFDGMQGYLSTITNVNEQLYLYGNLGSLGSGSGLHAWIGGARTAAAGSGMDWTWDASSIEKDTLNPGTIGNIEQTWYWVCGPEAGTAFYKTNASGTADMSGDEDQGVIGDIYNGWNRLSSPEPNNQNNGQYNDPYNQEYALEYGYEEANWNDYSPYNTRSEQYGIDGYIIEYSPYTKQYGSDAGETVDADTESAIDIKIVMANGVSMEADSFILSTDDAKNLTADEAKTAADVTVDDNGTTVNSDNGAITADPDQLNEIKNGETGKYDLEYTYTNAGAPDKNASKTVDVIVVDETAGGTAEDGSEVVIGANNFSITLEQAKTIAANPDGPEAQNILKTLANAVATDDGQPVDRKDIDVSVDTSKFKAEKGTYPDTVTFTYKGQSVTVDITVKDTGAADDNEDGTLPAINLTANDFSITPDDAAFTDDGKLDIAEFIEKSAAEARDENGAKVEVTIDSDDLDAVTNALSDGGKAGKYEVTVTAKDETGAEETTVVTVTVIKYPYIAGNDFIISVDDAKNTNADEIKDLTDTALVITKEESGSPDPVEVTDEEVNKLKDVTEPGTVTVTLTDTSANQAEPKQVTATVVDETASGTANDGSDAEIVIGANNFSITLEQAKTIAANPNSSEAQNIVKTLANAVATDDGQPVNRKNIQADAANIKAENGKYKVTFTYKGQTVEVEATVKDTGAADNTKPGLPATNLTANDFTIAGGDTPLSEDAFKDKADVEAKDSNGSSVPTTVNPDDLAKLNTAIKNGEKGQYQVTVTTPDGNTEKVTVTVTDVVSEKDSSGAAGTETIAANNIVIDINDIDKLTGDQASKNTIDLSNAHAYVTDTKADVAITKVDTSQVKKEAGTYNITLQTANGTTATITVTVKVTPVTGGDEPKTPDTPKDPDSSVVDESNMTGDELNNRDDLPLLLAKGIGGDKKINLTWLKYKGAMGYEVYWSYCNGKKVYKKVTSTTKLKATHKKLSYKKSYKYFVIAYKMVDGKKVYIAKSPQIHVAMKKDKRTNAKKVTTNKSKVTLKPGKTFKIKASITRENKKKKLLQHAVKFRYYTDDYRVATVDKKGKIKAVASGKCNIYVIANNGVYKKIKVTVKK